MAKRAQTIEETRFEIVKSMLAEFPELRTQVKGLLTWYA